MYVKYLWHILAIVSIPFVIFVLFMFSMLESNMETEIKNANTVSLLRVSNIMDASIQNIHNQAIRMANDTDVIYLLSDVFDYNPRRILDMLEGMTMTSPFVESVHLYSITDGRVVSIRGGGNIADFYDNCWYEEYIQNRDRLFWFQAREVRLPSVAGRRNNVITIFYSIVHVGNHKGAIIINLSMDRLSDFFEIGIGENIEIFDPFGYMIFPEINNGKLDVMLPDTPYSFISEDRSGVITYIRSFDTGLTYVSRSELQYSRHAANFSVITSTVFVIGFLIVILLAIYVLFVMMRPVKKIVSVIDDVNSKGVNEIDYIINAISNAKADKQKQEIELKVRIEMLEKAQIVAMQAQITPHFLLNILTTMRFMAMSITNGDNDVSKAITSLLDLYRVSLSGGEHFTRVSAEIEHVTHYIELQKIRFKDKFDVVFDVAPDVINMNAVKIMLQPIVENAITHGIRPMKDQGIINIKIYAENGTLFFEVSDNGIGMNAEKMAALNEYLQSDYFDSFEHIGVRNVNQRLKLIYGEEYGVQIKSEENKGTTVVIAIPAVERDIEL